MLNGTMRRAGTTTWLRSVALVAGALLLLGACSSGSAEDLDAAQAESEALRSELTESESQRRQLADELAVAEAELLAAQDDLYTIRIERDGRGEQVQQLERRLAELQPEIDRLTAELAGEADPTTAVSPTTCPEFRGLTCDGWLTDAADTLTYDDLLETLLSGFVQRTGNEIALVTVETTGDLTPRDFAESLGTTWGVGDPERNDGIVVLVALDEQRIEIVTGPGLLVDGLDEVAATGTAFFGSDEFDAGLVAVVRNLEEIIDSSAAASGG